MEKSKLTGVEEVLEHLQKFYTAAKGSRRGQKESRRLASLLTDYINGFSAGVGDIAQTVLVECSISVLEGKRPVQLPSYWQVPLVKDAQEKSAFATRSCLSNLHPHHLQHWRVFPTDSIEKH